MINNIYITLAQLAAVREIVQTGTVTAAAKNLHLTQPAVTQQIKLLENALGCSLFERHGRTMSPTQEGRMVFEKACEIADCMTALTDNLSRTREEVSGHLRIACGALTTIRILPGLLEQFLAIHPKVRFSITEVESSRIPDMLVHSQADIGMGLKPPPQKRILFKTLIKDQPVMICSANHPLAKAEQVTTTQMQSYPIIRMAPESTMWQIVDRQLNLKPSEYSGTMEVGNNLSVASFVRRNLGIGIVPSYILDVINTEGIVPRPIRPAIKLHFGILHLEKKYRSTAFREFMEFAGNRFASPPAG